MAGALSIQFDSKDSLLIIKNNTFYQGFATIGATFSIEFQNGAVYIENNLFFENCNMGTDIFQSGTGSASIYCVSLFGGKGFVIGNNNKYINNKGDVIGLYEKV